VRYRQALFLLSAFVAPAIHAETLYVIEQLVVNVVSTPDGAGQKVASIHSGDAVEVLDRQGDEIQVRLANGTQGWVKKSYLSAELPLQHRLTERTAEVDKLKQDITRLEAQLATARTAPRGKSASGAANLTTTAIAGPPASMTPPEAAVSSSTPTPTDRRESSVADPAARESSFFMTPPEGPARPVWHWVLGSSVIALGLGFALGWRMLDRRIRRKYGGLRIY
jgi:Bacterial SH3 domain